MHTQLYVKNLLLYMTIRNAYSNYTILEHFQAKRQQKHCRAFSKQAPFKYFTGPKCYRMLHPKSTPSALFLSQTNNIE